MGTGARIDTCNVIGGGVSSTDRIGGFIQPTSVLFRARFDKNNGMVAGFTQYMRCMIVQDRQQIAFTAPVAADLLTVATDFMSPMPLANVGRFNILYDQVIKMDVGSDYGKYVSKYINKGLLPIGFSSTSSGSISKNGLYVLTISDDSIASPSVRWNLRLRFTDK